MPAQRPGPTPDTTEGLWVANEFASCWVSRAQFGNGHRISVHSERRGTTVLLDATALDALSRLSPDQVSQLMTLVTERDLIDSPRSNP